MITYPAALLILLLRLLGGENLEVVTNSPSKEGLFLLREGTAPQNISRNRAKNESCRPRHQHISPASVTVTGDWLLLRVAFCQARNDDLRRSAPGPEGRRGVVAFYHAFGISTGL